MTKTKYKLSYKKLGIDPKDILVDYSAGVSTNSLMRKYFLRSQSDLKYLLKKAGITDNDKIKRFVNLHSGGKKK